LPYEALPLPSGDDFFLTTTFVSFFFLFLQVDITEGITKQVTLFWCRGCGKYLRPPWVHCELESRQLLALCLKKIKGINQVKLVDANFVWTEPHSRRIKIKLTVQKEVMNGIILQQAFVVEFVIQTQQCDACQKSYTEDPWKA
jgi:nonsense-mediated mRNA decay protein 3